ncbi:MAG: hypothetical protein KKB31_00975 [Nanoarchaeota archaeon]|nr:hypothetical protein [Nanoarchaeota archaeon]
MEKPKKKFTLIIILLLLGAVALTIYSRLDSEENKNTFEEGDAIDSFGEIIGSCSYNTTIHEEDGISSTTTKTIFYDPGKNYLGECHSYSGPGASGGAGTGCSGDIAINTGNFGQTWTDHTCTAWD